MEGTNKAGEQLRLHLDQNDGYYTVTWYGLCGYSGVTFPFDTAEQARTFYNAALEVQDYDAD